MWRNTWRLFLILTIMTGCFYPLMMTGLAQCCFPWQANGSLLKENNRIVGSKWIGQPFTSPSYFWGRPSATQHTEYNGSASGGSNIGPSNPKLFVTIQNRIKANNWLKTPIPSDLVCASASGLDPDISPEAAYYQVDRIAQAQRLPVEKLRALIAAHSQNRTGLFLGEPRVNVLELNLALYKEKS